MFQKRSNIVLIGYGYWGKKLAQTLTELKVSPYVVEKEQKIILPSGLQRISFQEFLSDPRFEIGILSTPEESHFHLAKKILFAGKHLFIEKPLSLLQAEAEELVQIALEKNVCLFVDYTFLYDAYAQEIKKIIDANSLGKIKNIQSIRYSAGFYKPNITVLDDLLTHDVYLGRFFLKDSAQKILTRTQKFQQSTLVECEIKIIFHEVQYVCEYSWIRPQSKRTLYIEGEKGSIYWNKEVPFLELTMVSEPTIHHKIPVVTSCSALNVALNHYSELCIQESGKNRINRYDQYIHDVLILEKARRMALLS